MSKLNEAHENPFDIVCGQFSAAVSPLFYQSGWTPNMVTTLSVIASAMAVRSVYLGNQKVAFIVWAILSYLFDCVDGYMARKYDMCTTFGDYYDHLSDWVYFLALFYVAFFVRGFKPSFQPFRMLFLAAIVLATVGMMVHMGLQEWVYQEETGTYNQGPTLNYFARVAKGICSLDPKDCIRSSRFLGTGTFIFVVIFIIAVFVK